MKKYKALTANTAQFWNISNYIFCSILLIFSIAGCIPKSEQDKINAINLKISPEGHLTPQYLFVNWPAKYAGSVVLAEPLKLQIPIEYLVPGLSFQKKSPAEYVEDSISIFDNHITMISLRVLPDGKPFTPIIGGQSTSPEEGDRLAAALKSSYSLNIMRDRYFKNHDIKQGTDQLVSIDPYGKYMKEAGISGLDRYILTQCFELDRIKSEPGGEQNLAKAMTYINSKAKDDHSPQNCYEERGLQYLVPAKETAFSNSELSFNCVSTGCNALLNLGNRQAIVDVSKENTVNQYVTNIANSSELKKLVADAQAENRYVDIKPFQQPVLDEIFTDLPNWPRKVMSARALLNSFEVSDKSSNLKTK